MRTLGVIVRVDSGGLSNQSREVWRHMRPEHTLVMLAGRNARGTEDVRRITECVDFPTDVTVHHGLTLAPGDLRRFARRCESLFTVETPYTHHGFEIAREAGARSVLLANPELFRVADHGWPDVLRVPTTWVLDRMEHARVLPQPVALDRFEQRVRIECTTFYHPSAPAMCDRNGTELLLAALPHVSEPCTVIVRQVGAERSRQVGNVTLQTLRPHPGDYWQSYPDEADVMVLPRRYGGLSLSVMESAACGMPSIMLDVHPATEWPGVVTVPVTHHQRVSMKGGDFPVWQADARALAAAMDAMVTDPDRVRRYSNASLDWARANSWDALLPQWIGTLR